MLIAPSHITLVGNSKKITRIFLNQFGYKLIFIEKDIQNPTPKLSFLRNHYQSHSLSYFQPDYGIPIEVIEYDNHQKRSLSFLNPVFGLPRKEVSRNCRKDRRWQDAWISAFPSSPLFFISKFKALAYVSVDGDYRRGAGCIIVPIRDMACAKKFWIDGFHCKLLSEGITSTRLRWALIKFEALRGFRSLSIILAQSTQLELSPMLDDKGFNCLSFISTNLDHDIQNLSKLGVKEISDTFQLNINKRNLTICFVRGINEELIEFYEIVRH